MLLYSSENKKLRIILSKEDEKFLIKHLYTKNKYIDKNPSLHEEDSPWKVECLTPYLDYYSNLINKEDINILDVGGGSGLVLYLITKYIETKYSLNIKKYILDLSSGMLEIQKKINPDLKKVYNEDICNTSIESKKIDLLLMIDVLEHIPDYKKALKEIKRISNYVILKVPLEDNLLYNTLNIITNGEFRKKHVEDIGHINYYNEKKLKNILNEYLGEILDYGYANVSKYYIESEHYSSTMSLENRIVTYIQNIFFRISPKLSTYLFNDYLLVLIKCY